MSRLTILLMLPAVLAAQDTPPSPKLAIKVEIKIRIEGGDPVILAAKRPEMAARANMWTREKFWRLMFSASQPEVPGSALSFIAAVDPNDLPGGGFYICKMKKDDDKFFFNTSSDAAGSPKNDFVALKPSDIKAVKGADGSFTFNASKPLKPGAYAFYVADNQYAWPFTVK